MLKVQEKQFNTELKKDNSEREKHLIFLNVYLFFTV